MMLRHIDPARKCKRFYVMRIERTLFGEWSLQREWGRVGSPGRITIETFSTEQEARAAETDSVCQRIRHGYD